MEDEGLRHLGADVENTGGAFVLQHPSNDDDDDAGKEPLQRSLEMMDVTCAVVTPCLSGRSHHSVTLGGLAIP